MFTAFCDVFEVKQPRKRQTTQFYRYGTTGAHRQRGRETHRQRDRETHRQRDREAERHTGVTHESAQQVFPARIVPVPAECTHVPLQKIFWRYFRFCFDERKTKEPFYGCLYHRLNHPTRPDRGSRNNGTRKNAKQKKLHASDFTTVWQTKIK